MNDAGAKNYRAQVFALMDEDHVGDEQVCELVERCRGWGAPPWYAAIKVGELLNYQR